MCEHCPDRKWRGIGLSSYSGNYIVLEQCVDCGAYRVRLLEDGISALPVVTGMPEFDSETATATDAETESDDSGTEPDGWLVDE